MALKYVIRKSIECERWQTMIDQLDIVESKVKYDCMVASLSSNCLDHSIVLSFVNAHAMNILLRDHLFYDSLVQSDILLRDGAGMSLLYRILHLDPGYNMNGTDFIPKILSSHVGAKVAIWGTDEPYLSRAVHVCSIKFNIEVISVENGFYDAGYYLKIAHNLDVQVILLGMGMPKQEILAHKLKNVINKPMIIICGGAIIDFLGEKTLRAPLILRKMGLEWVYRLWLEPKRMFSRYVIGNPLFLLRALLFSLFR